MNKISTKYLTINIAVALMFGSVVLILLPRSVLQSPLIAKCLDIFNTDLRNLSFENSMFDENFSSHNVSKIPSFNNKKSFHFDALRNEEVDFTATSYSTTDVQSKKNKVVNSNVQISTSTNLSYNYQKPQVTGNYTSSKYSISSSKNTFQSSNTVYPVNKSFEPMGFLDANNSSKTNINSNTFLANNSLSITVDLPDNNSAMLVGGGSNPGDPGVPVGDGIWIMILFLGFYCFRIRY